MNTSVPAVWVLGIPGKVKSLPNSDYKREVSSLYLDKTRAHIPDSPHSPVKQSLIPKEQNGVNRAKTSWTTSGIKQVIQNTTEQSYSGYQQGE